MFALLLLAGFYVSNAAETYTHPETHIDFPAEVAGFKRDNVQPFTVPNDKGTSITYKSPEIHAVATIYIRDLPPGSTFSAQAYLNDSLAAIKSLEQRGIYQNVKVSTDPPSANSDGWKRGSFTATIENRFAMSFLLCTVKGDHAFKIRVTCSDPKNTAKIHEFTKEIQNKINSSPSPKK